MTTRTTTRTDPLTPTGDEPVAPTIEVTPGPDGCFEIDVRGHRLTADRRHDHPGHERGPQPVEIFVAGLASCVATYAAGYLARHGVELDGLSVTASFGTGGHPYRITDIALVLTVPPGLPRERYAALLSVAQHCTVHHTLVTRPHVAIHLEEPPVTDTDESAHEREQIA